MGPKDLGTSEQKEIEQKIVAKFSLIDLAGSERILEQEKNPERRMD